VYSRQANSIKYLSYLHKANIRICLRGMGWVFRTRSSKLEKVQLESTRIASGLTKCASRDSFYYATGWEPLSCRRKYRKLTTFYKMHSKLCPQYLLQYLVSVIIISEAMKTIQHQEVDSECLWHPLYHLLFRYGTI
jgi:hypothetical protein